MKQVYVVYLSTGPIYEREVSILRIFPTHNAAEVFYIETQQELKSLGLDCSSSEYKDRSYKGHYIAYNVAYAYVSGPYDYEE
jgi:hypothetical protein